MCAAGLVVVKAWDEVVTSNHSPTARYTTTHLGRGNHSEWCWLACVLATNHLPRVKQWWWPASPCLASFFSCQPFSFCFLTSRAVCVLAVVSERDGEKNRLTGWEEGDNVPGV